MDIRTVDIYSYQDFRSYLKDFYKDRRAKDRKFSIRFFARRAGLRSQNYLKVVMDGRRSLTSRNLHKFVKGLGLAGPQAEYFEALVNLNQARDEVEKKLYLGRLEHLQKKKATHQLSGEQLEIFSNWHHLVIFEMASQEDFKLDPEKISKRLKGRVTSKQVQESLDLMFKTGLLKTEIGGRGVRSVTSKIAFSDQVEAQYRQKLHEAFLEMAMDALKNEKIEDRENRSLTIGLSPDQVPAFKAKIQEFQREMNALFSTGKGTEIYQLNLQFFKLTKND